jgi:nucleotide-binding universal stress UspA family protein
MPDGLRLLVGLDFSEDSLRALRAARRLKDRAGGGSITILHVRPPSDVRAAVLEERGDLLKQPPSALKVGIAEHYRKRLSAIVGGRDDESWKIAQGKPAVEICREARRGYEAIVLGGRGAGAAVKLILGSTVQEVLHRATLPVVVSPAR